MSEMFENVAAAIRVKLVELGIGLNNIDVAPSIARAAIEAMRAQPITQSVMERIIRNNRAMRGGESLMSELWSAMIDAALSEQP